jgi:hypothetical protein
MGAKFKQRCHGADPDQKPIGTPACRHYSLKAGRLKITATRPKRSWVILAIELWVQSSNNIAIVHIPTILRLATPARDVGVRETDTKIML